ncbi:hypothetical protein A6V36_32310 [Paraburkholderia ginsengiterrae]|uniref:Uncharacterized protein n=1 Tax=Paraburkholderia ginsengiterrae TaxID=1462993 RepID=A0A1A9N9Q9_9BURK|nr:hypothetical protein A6V36_32310 [Paraburkholderia ginsengiterrae]OAJ61344.1 hypothetical protein A6V37_25350 [Paraburkholderia ginsengiterrae]
MNNDDFTVIYATRSMHALTDYPREDFIRNAVRTLPSLTETEPIATAPHLDPTASTHPLEVIPVL